MPTLHRLLACFGNGDHGRLGTGFPCKSQYFPRAVAQLLGYTIKQVSCFGAHTAVVTDDGSLFTFGLNEDGQLGHSQEARFIPVPLEVGLPDTVVAVAAGDRHTVALTGSGEIWSWGQTGEGALGIGHVEERQQFEPRLVKDLQGAQVVAVAAGGAHSMALTAGGEVFSWGSGAQGQLGLNTNQHHTVPKRVSALKGIKVKSISAGYFSSGCLDADGNAYTWGLNAQGQLGLGQEMRHVLGPAMMTGVPRIQALALGQSHGLAISAGNRLFSWGQDDHGTLALGKPQFLKTQGKPQEIRSEEKWKQVACGWRHSAAVTQDGKLFTWGYNGADLYKDSSLVDVGAGQLGHGEEKDAWVPTQVMRLHASATRFYDVRHSHANVRTGAPVWKACKVSLGRHHSSAILEAAIDPKDIT